MKTIKIDVPESVVETFDANGKATLKHEHFPAGYVTLYDDSHAKTDLFTKPSWMFTEPFILLDPYAVKRFRNGEIISVTFNNSGTTELLELKQIRSKTIMRLL